MSRYGELLANPDYRALWLSQCVEQLADGFRHMGLVAVVVQLSHYSAFAMAKLASFSLLPGALSAVIGGICADRWSRRQILLYGFLSIAVFALAATRGRTLVVILAAAALLSAAKHFLSPARSAAVPTVIREDQLITASALGSLALLLVGSVVSPVLGGRVVDSAGWRTGLLVCAGLCLLAMGLVWRAHIPLPAGLGSSSLQTAGWPLFNEFRAFVALARKDRRVAFLVGLWAPLMFASGALIIAAAMLVLKVMKGGTTHLGMLVAMFGLGAAAGAACLGHWAGRRSNMNYIVIGLIAAGATLVLMAVFVYFWFSLALGLAIGLESALVTVPSVALVQEIVPEGLRGKTFGLIGALFGIASLAAMLAAGKLTDAIGARSVLALLGLALFVTGAVGAGMKGRLSSVLR